MFWKKKPKLPVSIEDKEWIESELEFLKQEFGNEHFNKLITITPTKNFYNIKFSGIKKDAEFVLKRTMELMKIKSIEINLEFYSDEAVLMNDGAILTTPGDINGKWKSSAGMFEQTENGTTIYLEESQLNNPISLIATISHELSHQILLGENRIEENDEYLTDLTAIVYGYGIFLGNSKFNYSNHEKGWGTTSQGYLPEQVIAYTMAYLSFIRKENTDYRKYLKKSILKYFNQSIDYLETKKEKKQTT